jgi:uncharacterized protein (DUF849 family)
VKATNLMLVERLVRQMADLGIEPTSAAESREILGLKPL